MITALVRNGNDLSTSRAEHQRHAKSLVCIPPFCSHELNTPYYYGGMVLCRILSIGWGFRDQDPEKKQCWERWRRKCENRLSVPRDLVQNKIGLRLRASNQQPPPAHMLWLWYIQYTNAGALSSCSRTLTATVHSTEPPAGTVLPLGRHITSPRYHSIRSVCMTKASRALEITKARQLGHVSGRSLLVIYWTQKYRYYRLFVVDDLQQSPFVYFGRREWERINKHPE